MSWMPFMVDMAPRVCAAQVGAHERWFVVAPLEDGELLTCVFRAALVRDLNAAARSC